MIKKIEYDTEQARQNIIADNANLILIEEQNITEGNFLIFTDEKPLENQIADLQDNQQTIKDGMADMFIAISSIPGVVL